MTVAADKTPILVADDEPPILRLLQTALGAEGFRMLEAKDGKEAIAAIADEKPDAVILDLGLPDINGLEVIRHVRAQGEKVPIIVLSSHGDERTKIEAFNLDADDYVTKPFSILELVARLRTAIRHRIQEQGSEPVFRSGDLTVDLVRRIVTVRGAEVHLAPKEYDILRLLVLRAGMVLTHDFLVREIWGAAGQVQYLRIYIRQLRQKIEQDPERPAHIITETAVGYRLQMHEIEAAA
ncbi:MAG: response regulator transcription factor [Rhodomicrobium sp.]